MSGFWSDMRLAFRTLQRSPGYSLGVVLVLALGVGANTAMFTVLRSTLLQPLRFRDPGGLVRIKAENAAGTDVWVRFADALAWQARSHTLEAVGFFDPGEAVLGQAHTQQQVSAVQASANLFSTLGVQPELGRGFSPTEQQPGRGDEVVLSDDVWRSQFGGSPHVLGQAVRLNDTPMTVVGIMPRGFAFPADSPALPQVWQPMTLTPDARSRRMDRMQLVSVVGRRRPGFSTAAVAADLDSLQRSFLPLYAAEGIAPELVPAHVTAITYRESLHTRQRAATLALTGATALLWLIACADVASLSLARGAARRRDAAVRTALGATRWRLLRQGLLEAVLLSTAAGALGLAFAELALLVFRHQLTRAFGPGLVWQPDAVVLSGLCGLTLFSAAVFAVVPLLVGATGGGGRAVEQALRSDGAQAGTGRRRHHLQRWLVTAELALTLSLLVGCGLLLRTVMALQAVPLGFRTDGIVSITPHLPPFRYRDVDTDATILKPLAARLRALPGVEAVAITSVAPLAGRFDVNFMLNVTSTGKNAGGSHGLEAKLRAAGPELQRVLGFNMRSGRFFDPARDTPTSTPVAVVNEAFARLYAPAGDVMHFHLGSKNRSFSVVGVVDDFHQQGIAQPAAPEIDLNAAQLRPTDGFYQPTLKAHAEILLRSTRDPRSLMPEVRRTLAESNPDLADAGLETMNQIVADAMGSQLLAAHLLETLGGLALLVALTGLYSLLAYLVTLRRRELGVRLALGANRGDIHALVLRGAAGMLAGGAVLGLVLSAAGAHLLAGLLYGVPVFDAATLALATCSLLTVGLLAAWLPARRASLTEPTVALRAD